MAKKTIDVNGTTWTGTSKQDNVFIDADYVSVNTGAGNDSIKNRYIYAWYSTINAGDGNDTITFEESRQSSINAGAGNDKISLSGGYYLTISGGKGNDTVYAEANHNLYQYASSDGNDVIYNWGAGDTISITGAKYTKKTSGSDVILTVGSGKITLVGAKDKAFTVKGTLAGGGKNINNTKSKKTITGTSYADTIKNSANYVTINAGAGNDKIDNTKGARSSINAGNGNDSIYDGSRYSTLIGGTGNDTITTDGDTVTVDAGTGDDSLNNKGNYAVLSLGEGNDTIHNWGGNTSISAGAGKDFIATSTGKNVTLDCGDGNDTVHNWSERALIRGGSGNDDIMNGSNVRADYSTIDCGDDDDTISNYSNYTSLFGGKGNDYISNGGYYDCNNSTINGGNGNDTIITFGAGSKIYGGTGNDSIFSDVEGSIESGSKISVFGGAGDDTIRSDSAYSILDGGDNNDTLINFGWNSSVNGGTGNDYIENVCFFGDEGSYVTIKGGTGNDTVSLNSSVHHNLIEYASGDGNDIIYNFGATDTLKITGAKYTKKNSGSDVILTVGKGKITLKGAKGKTLNIDGTLDGKLNIPSDAYTYNGHSYYIYSGVAKTWNEAKTYCEARGGHLAVINNAKENTKLFNYMKSKGYDSAYFGLSDAAKEGTWTWATGEKVSYKNFASGEPNGGTYENYGMFYYVYEKGNWNDGDFSAGSTFYLDGKLIKDTNAFICEWDTVSSSSTTAKIGYDFVATTSGIPYDLGTTVTVGIKNSSGNTLNGTDGNDNFGNMTANKIIYGLNGNDTLWNLGGNSVKLDAGTGNDRIYNTSYYSTLSGGAGNDTIYSYGIKSSILGGAGKDLIYSYGTYETVNGGAGNDNIKFYGSFSKIYGGDDNDTITATTSSYLTLNGGAGNDSLWGGENSDTLIGGAGDDIFVYKPGEGTDHITDFSGSDMLKILKTNGREGGTFTKATFSGGNLTLAISGGGTVILDNVKAGQSININGTIRTISGKTLK